MIDPRASLWGGLVALVFEGSGVSADEHFGADARDVSNVDLFGTQIPQAIQWQFTFCYHGIQQNDDLLPVGAK